MSKAHLNYIDAEPLAGALALYREALGAHPYYRAPNGDVDTSQDKPGADTARLAAEEALDAAISRLVAEEKLAALRDAGAL